MNDTTLNEIKLFHALRNLDASDTSELFVSSMRDASYLLELHMHPAGAQYRTKLVEYITNPDNQVLGDCDVYHNFIMKLFDTYDYNLGIKVCDYALSKAPYNRDILADVLKACGESSQFEKGDVYLKRALEIPLESWNFRLFLYGTSFLKTKLSAFPLNEELFNRALSLADDYIHYFPYDEHGYNLRAELLLIMNKTDQAIAELKEYIMRTQPDKHNSKSELVAAQCCVTLLNILHDNNNYDFIIEICDKGLQHTTKEQPTASIGFFMYRKALALDAKAHDEKFRVPDTVTDALKFYQAAYDLSPDHSYQHTIEQRYAVLRPYATNFEPLVKRPLYITEAETYDTSEE